MGWRDRFKAEGEPSQRPYRPTGAPGVVGAGKTNGRPSETPDLAGIASLLSELGQSSPGAVPRAGLSAANHFLRNAPRPGAGTGGPVGAGRIAVGGSAGAALGRLPQFAPPRLPPALTGGATKPDPYRMMPDLPDDAGRAYSPEDEAAAVQEHQRSLAGGDAENPEERAAEGGVEEPGDPNQVASSFDDWMRKRRG